MTLILVSKTPIVIQIFKLICKKLNIGITVVDEPAKILQDYDFVIIDFEFIDDDFNNYKKYSKN